MADTQMHGAGGPGILAMDWVLAAPFAFAAVVYLGAVIVQARRGRPWRRYRSCFWVLGLAAGASGFVGPLAAAAHDSFTAHMAVHLLVGMVAPLFLVLAAPGTLALRALSVPRARRLSRVLGSPGVRTLTNPVVAAMLNVGGLWLVYLTPLYQLMQQQMLVHLLVMAHFLFAGFLYTAALIRVDPSPHRSHFAMRSSVLVLSLAAHGILAKLLYAYPSSGVAAEDARAGAQLMFYGGDVIDFILIVLIWAEWYRVTGRRLPPYTRRSRDRRAIQTGRSVPAGLTKGEPA